MCNATQQTAFRGCGNVGVNMGKLAAALSIKKITLPVLFVYILSSTPVSETHYTIFYATNVKFTDEQISDMRAIGQMGGLIATAAFPFFASRR
jgi:hypothetical protein